MLYLDASALVKRYLREPGSDLVNARFGNQEQIFTSALSYAEVYAALGRKYRVRELTRSGFAKAQDEFLQDFILALSVLEVDTNTMTAVRNLVEHYPIRGADAVHLSAAIWLRDMVRLVPEFARGERLVEFGTSDEQLARFAHVSGLTTVHF